MVYGKIQHGSACVMRYASIRVREHMCMWFNFQETLYIKYTNLAGTKKNCEDKKIINLLHI